MRQTSPDRGLGRMLMTQVKKWAGITIKAICPQSSFNTAGSSRLITPVTGRHPKTLNNHAVAVGRTERSRTGRHGRLRKARIRSRRARHPAVRRKPFRLQRCRSQLPRIKGRWSVIMAADKSKRSRVRPTVAPPIKRALKRVFWLPRREREQRCG